MNILISGASGLLGSKLTDHFGKAGHTVIKLARKKSDQSSPSWDPANNSIDLGNEPIEAVIHLAGENISSGRWSNERKTRIRESRVTGTNILARALAKREVKPKVMIIASAVGFYGNRGEEILDESAEPGDGFLATVCIEWEKAATCAKDAGIRLVNTRFGMILSPKGGALQKMLTPFKIGLGGNIGNGKQFISWISIDDVAGVMEFILNNGSVKGAVNTVSPNPVTNSRFTKILAAALHRPALVALPAFVAKIIFGEMAAELLLSSTRAVPKKLQEYGYDFQHPDLKELLEGWFTN